MVRQRNVATVSGEIFDRIDAHSQMLRPRGVMCWISAIASTIVLASCGDSERSTSESIAPPPATKDGSLDTTPQPSSLPVPADPSTVPHGVDTASEATTSATTTPSQDRPPVVPELEGFGLETASPVLDVQFDHEMDMSLTGPMFRGNEFVGAAVDGLRLRAVGGRPADDGGVLLGPAIWVSWQKNEETGWAPVVTAIVNVEACGDAVPAFRDARELDLTAIEFDCDGSNVSGTLNALNMSVLTFESS